MSKNRQQLKTGLRAILGGGLREEPAPESEHTPQVEAFEPEPVRTLLAIVETPPAELKETRVLIVKPPDIDEEPADEAQAFIVAPEEPARKQRKKPAAPPPMLSSTVAGSRPTFLAKATDSQTASMPPAMAIWLASLQYCPEPAGPWCTIALPIF